MISYLIWSPRFSKFFNLSLWTVHLVREILSRFTPALFRYCSDIVWRDKENTTFARILKNLNTPRLENSPWDAVRCSMAGDMSARQVSRVRTLVTSTTGLPTKDATLTTTVELLSTLILINYAHCNCYPTVFMLAILFINVYKGYTKSEDQNTFKFSWFG